MGHYKNPAAAYCRVRTVVDRKRANPKTPLRPNVITTLRPGGASVARVCRLAANGINESDQLYFQRRAFTV